MMTRFAPLTRAGAAIMLAAICGPALAVFAVAGPAYAATHTVTTTQDADDLGACANPAITTGAGADGQLSLREALCRARNDGTGTVAVPAGTCTLSQGTLGTDPDGAAHSLKPALAIPAAGDTAVLLMLLTGLAMVVSGTALRAAVGR